MFQRDIRSAVRRMLLYYKVVGLNALNMCVLSRRALHLTLGAHLARLFFRMKNSKEIFTSFYLTA